MNDLTFFNYIRDEIEAGKLRFYRMDYNYTDSTSINIVDHKDETIMITINPRNKTYIFIKNGKKEFEEGYRPTDSRLLHSLFLDYYNSIQDTSGNDKAMAALRSAISKIKPQKSK